MSIGSLLSGIGRGAAAVLEPLGKRTAEVVSGEAPQIDEEKRQQAMQLSEEQRELKANDLESQLEMGRKYGTLTADQQKQYVDAITNLYSRPQDQGSLLQRLHKAIHPQGTVRQAAQLPSAVPPGGTAQADEAAKERELKTRMEAEKPNYKAYRLPDDSIVNIDVNHEAPPDGAVPVGPEAANQKALNEYRSAVLDLQQKKEELAAAKLAADQDPNNPATRQKALQAQANVTRAQAYMLRAEGQYLGSYNGKPLPGALLTEGGTPMGSSFGGNYFKSAQALAQLNDAQGAITATGNTLKTLYASGSSLNNPNVAAALANPEWTVTQLLQGVAAKSLTPAETDAVIAIKSARENIQGMRKAAGGGLSNEQVNRLEAQLPGPNTPNAEYAAKQLQFLNQTLLRLSTGVPHTVGGPAFTGVTPGQILAPQTGAKPVTGAPPRPANVPPNAVWNSSANNGRGAWQLPQQ